MRFKTGDKVIAITGKDKGNTGRISKVLRNDDKVIIEGLNIIKKHVKPSANNQTGGIVSMEAPIQASNVMFFDEKNNKRSRVRVEAAVKKAPAKKAEVKEAKEVKKATVKKVATKTVEKAAPKKAKAKKD